MIIEAKMNYGGENLVKWGSEEEDFCMKKGENTVRLTNIGGLMLELLPGKQKEVS